MAQLMPLPLTVSCFSKIQTGFTFLVPAHPGSHGKRAVKRMCVLQHTLSTFDDESGTFDIEQLSMSSVCQVPMRSVGKVLIPLHYVVSPQWK